MLQLVTTKLPQTPSALRRRLERGATLQFRRDAPRVILVERGAIATVMSSSGTPPVVIQVFGPGSCFIDDVSAPELPGYLPAFTVLQTATIVQAPVRSLAEHMEGSIDMLLRSLRVQGRHLTERLLKLRVRDPLQRVAGGLLYLVDSLGEGCAISDGTQLGITQQMLALVTGLARQTANRELRRLATARLVVLRRGSVCVIDRAQLERTAMNGALPLPVAMAPIRCRLVHPDAPLDCAIVPLRRA